ncbi:DNA cytosine methyltransferase [Bacteroides nordii]|uniref:DNA cytosine methyltransferase n=1 Tax=Bacteroides nordii TaxID=291645 RepID=UPI001899CFDD|nr:DNA cytosine methyltransferase [Bacteroides nordii]
MIGIFSFFAGAGFLDLGFEMTYHFETLFVNEFKQSFNDIYQFSRRNMGITAPQFGHHVGDISQWLNNEQWNAELHGYINQARQREDIDMVGFIGGPPCPDFSVAGKNKGREGDNGRLSQTYVDLICNSLPDFFVFENVKGLYRTARHRAFFEELKQQLTLAGYAMTEQLINSR